MAETSKILWQHEAPNTNLADVYTVPALTRAVVSSVSITNPTASDATFRLAFAVAGAADTPKQYIYYDLDIVAKDTFVATIGITLGPADIVRFKASASGLVCQGFGVEET